MRPSYNAIGDPFKMVGQLVSLGAGNDPHKVGGHDMPFRPGGNKYPYDRAPKYAAAEWLPEGGPKPDPKRCRDEDGAVIVKQPNMLCSPGKKGRVGRRD